MSPAPPRIRPATAADVPAMGAIVRRNVAEVLPATYPPDELAQIEAEMSGPVLAAQLGHMPTWVAEGPDGAVLGFIGLREDRVRTLFVAPEAQGTGVGGALLRTALEAARAEGHAEVWVHSSLNAEGFYARHGFEPVERIHEPGAVRVVRMRAAL